MYRWINPEDGRYYTVYLGVDLLGYWIPTKAWGGLNSHRGQIRKVWVATKEAGLKAIQALDKRRRKRGYCSVATPTAAPVQRALPTLSPKFSGRSPKHPICCSSFSR